MTTVYCLILNLVHLLYDLLSYVHRQWVRVKRSVTFGKNLDGVEAISSRIDNLSKVPNHIVVLFVDNEVPGADLARIISWCYAARIPHLSFYSYYGMSFLLICSGSFFFFFVYIIYIWKIFRDFPRQWELHQKRADQFTSRVGEQSGLE